MKRTSKTLTSLAAASMVITQASQMSVFANDFTTNTTSANEALRNVKKTQKETLEDSIYEAQTQVDQVQSDLNKEQMSLNGKKMNLDSAKVSKSTANKIFGNTNQNVNSYVSNSIVVNKATIEEAKKELDNLKAEKDRLEKESEASKVQKGQLEKDYKEAQDKYNSLISQGTIEDLDAQIKTQQKVLEDANKALIEAQDRFNALQAQYDKVVGEISGIESKIVEQQAKVDNLSAKLNKQTTEKQKALDALNDAQQAYDAATDESVKAELEAQLASAQETFKKAEAEYTAAEGELETESETLKSYQSELVNSKLENDEAVKAFELAQVALEQSLQNKSTAEQTLKNLQDSLNGVQEEIKKAEADVSAKKDLLDSITKGTEELSKLVEATKAAYEAVQAQWNQGSLAFYESIGDTQAVEVLKEGIQLGTTTLGDAGDATNLFNMKVSIPLIAECNRLRKLNGLPEMNTSGLMMAISQVMSNHSVYREGNYDSGHTELYNTGENIASGFTWDIESQGQWETLGRGPFVGWYNWEKQWLEDFYKEHPEEKNKNIYDTLTRYPSLYERTGHYLNILAKGYKVSGAAYIPNNKNDLSDTSGFFAQEFSNNHDAWDYGAGFESVTVDGKRYDNRIGQMTVSEFETKFNKYYDDLKTELDVKKAAYENAKKALKDAESNDKALANATKAYEEAQAALRKLLATQTTIENQIQEAKGAVSDANVAVRNAQTVVDKAKGEKSEKTKAVEAAQAKVDAQKKVVDSKAQKVADTKVTVDNAKKAVNAAKETIKKSEQSVATLKGQLEVAKAEMDGKEKAYEETRKNLEEAKGELSELNTNKAEKETEKEGVAKAKTLAESDKETAKIASNKASTALTELEQGKREREDLKASLEANLESQEKAKKELADILAKGEENTAKISESEKEVSSLEMESARLNKVSAMYQDIINGVMLANIEEDFLTDEENTLFNELRAAMSALDEAENNLAEAQQTYDSEKEKYDELAEKLANAKAELKKAQDALEAYLKLTATSGWHKVNDDWYFVDENGSVVTNDWIGSYYLGSDGKMAKDTIIDGYYVDSNGVWVPDKWIQSGSQWWYRHGEGTYTTNDFEEIGNQTYYFDGSGYMVTGWKQVGSDWYYFNGTGAMEKNQWIGNYYLGADGKMK